MELECRGAKGHTVDRDSFESQEGVSKTFENMFPVKIRCYFIISTSSIEETQ